MKYVLCLCLMILSSCGPKFKAGDCLNSTSDKESWQRSDILKRKVIEVGKKHYHLIDLPYGLEVDAIFSDFSYVDMVYEKVDCK